MRKLLLVILGLRNFQVLSGNYICTIFTKLNLKIKILYSLIVILNEIKGMF
jgi:hypothetical protein